MIPGDNTKHFESSLSWGLIFKWFCLQNYANRTENSHSSGTEQKDLARVFSDCVLHKENYAFVMESVS